MKILKLMLICSMYLLSSEKFYTYDDIYEKDDIAYDIKTKKPINGVLTESGLHLPYRNGKINGCGYSLYYDGLYHNNEAYYNNENIGPIVNYYDNGNIKNLKISQNKSIVSELIYYMDGTLKYQMNFIKKNGDETRVSVVGYYPSTKKQFEATLMMSSHNDIKLISGYLFDENGQKRKVKLNELKDILK
ncbi:MAG: hypothetical protein LGB66_05330 [Sulfurovum sp.]|nr:hypothetical protein [Sulfurovum sp.]